MYTRPVVILSALLTACPGPVDTGDTGGEVIDPSTCTAWNAETSGTLDDDCYRLSDGVRVSNAIVLSAGTVVVADANASLTIEGNGSLRTNGTQADPVRFEGVSSGAGTWRGISFSNTPSGENVLSWLQIDGAGGQNWNGAEGSSGALFADGGSRIAADNLTITNSAGIGITWWDNDVDATLDTVTISSTAQAMSVHPRHTTDFSGAFLLDGDDPTVHISNDTLDDDTTMPALDYTIEIGLDVAADLTIEPGATLSFSANTSVVIDGGSLNAEGTADAPITLQGLEAVSGYWLGVRLQTSPSANNVWTHVSILHGGSQPWNGNDDSDASVFLDNDNIRLTVTDSRIADSDAAGIRIELDAVNDDVSFERVAFDNTEEPVKTSPAGVASLGADLTFSGNDDTVIRVLAGDLNEDATWLNHGIDYALPVGMDVYADLTLSPGSQLRFGPGARLRISDAISGGVLIADAEGGDPILFSGMEQTPGYWLGISLNTATGSNVLHNTRIEYAGSNSWNGNPDNIGALFLQSGSRLELRDTTFANNLGDSDVLVAGASTVISGCTNITGTFRGDAQATFCTQ